MRVWGRDASDERGERMGWPAPPPLSINAEAPSALVAAQFGGGNGKRPAREAAPRFVPKTDPFIRQPRRPPRRR